MKILCLIDSLGSGGAQRQLATLAMGLKKRGHEVRFLVYHKDDHFLPLLQAADILCQVVPPCSYMQRIFALRRILRQGWQDVVLAFLEVPCFCAELACIPRQRWGLVVGERSADPCMKNGTGPWRRQLHRVSDVVVCNSHTTRLMLEAGFPFLKKNLVTVYNTVDLKQFHSSFNDTEKDLGGGGVFRIVVAASYHGYKNMENVAKALLCLNKNKSTPLIVVDWYGPMPADSTAFKKAEGFIAENNLAETMRLHPSTRDIVAEFSRADAIGLFSLFEGLPNVICEGMACGKPILLSNICDAGNLVRDGKNGFLCDPASPEAMAAMIGRLVDLSESERRQMGLESRRMAEELFAEHIVIDRYERILSIASRHEPLPTGCSWPSGVPETSTMTVERWIKSNR